MTTDCKTCVGGYIDELTTCENGTIIKRSALDGNVVSFKKCINKPEKPKIVPIIDCTNEEYINELKGKRFFAITIDENNKARFHCNQFSDMEMVYYATELVHRVHSGEF